MTGSFQRLPVFDADVRWTGRTPVFEYAPIGKLHLLEQRAGLAGAQRCGHHSKMIVLPDHVELPASAIENARVRALDGPLAHLALRILRLQVDVDVRVLLDELRHRALEPDLVVVVKNREGMVCGDG